MKNKHCKPAPFPPKIRAAFYKKQIERTYFYIEKCYSILSILPSQHFTYILKLKEAFNSLSTQGMDISLEKLCEDRYKKNASAILIKRIDSYLAAIDYIQNLDKKEYATIPFWQKLHMLAEKDFFKIEEDIGRIRTRQNWIGPKNCTAQEAFFFPPSPEKMPLMMHDLQQYLHEEREPLLQLGVGFAQFLLIHPFMDGNGRVARLFAASHIVQKGILKEPLLFLSHYFLRHRVTYLKKLFILTFHRKWTAWLDFYFKAICSEAKALYHTLSTLTDLYIDMRNYLNGHLPEKQMERALIFLFKHPVFLKTSLKEKARLSPASTDALLYILCNKKIIRKKKNGFYVFSSLLKLGEKK